MREKLANDQTLTPTQTAEITKDMERTGCGTLPAVGDSQQAPR